MNTKELFRPGDIIYVRNKKDYEQYKDTFSRHNIKVSCHDDFGMYLVIEPDDYAGSSDYISLPLRFKHFFERLKLKAIKIFKLK